MKKHQPNLELLKHGVLRRALLVEDDKVIEFVYRKFLERLGFQVQSVSNGLAAIDCAKKEHYDVMLLDIGLPDVSGEFVLCSIRFLELSIQKRLPVIISTAHGNEATLQACRGQGADAIFQKPLSFETLQKSLETIVPAVAVDSW